MSAGAGERGVPTHIGGVDGLEPPGLAGQAQGVAFVELGGQFPGTVPDGDTDPGGCAAGSRDATDTAEAGPLVAGDLAVGDVWLCQAELAPLFYFDLAPPGAWR